MSFLPVHPISGPLSLCLFFVLASVVIWTPGVAAYFILRHRGQSRSVAFAGAPLVIGSLGWIVFFTWLISDQLPALVVSALALAISAAVIVRCWSIARVTELKIVLVALCVGCCFVSAMVDKGIDPDPLQASALRYWGAPDNKVSMMFADGMISGEAKTVAPKPIMSNWHYSDRPPLMTGIILPAYSIAPSEIWFQLLAMSTNLIWMFGLMAFLLSTGATEHDAAMTVIVVAFVGAIFISEVYVWPKLLAASLALSAAALIRETSTIRGVVAAACAAMLALLAHGAAAFGLIGLLPVIWSQLKRHSLPNLALAGLCAIALYAPWIGYQKLIDPPGDRLLKWHIAGQIEPDDRSFIDALGAQFRNDGVMGTIYNKVNNVRLALGADYLQREKTVRTIRDNTLQFILPSAGILLIGIIASIAVGRVRRSAPIRLLWKAVLATAAVFCLLESGSSVGSAAWLHHSSYTLILLWSALGALSLAQIRTTLSYSILMATPAFFYFVWVNSLPYQAAFQTKTDAPLLLDARLLTWGFLVAVYLLMPRLTDRAEHAPVPA